MDWARKREWTVIAVLTAFTLAVLAILAFAILYKTPTCTDQKLDGDERGVDCGGSCSTVCSADAEKASVRFARVLQQSGRDDLIAYIDNPNTDVYARNVRLVLDFYSADGHLTEKHAQLSLPANRTTPLFLPGIVNAPVERVFVSFANGSPQWTKGTGASEILPKASNLSVSGADAEPHLTATVTNVTAYAEHAVPFVATVFDADGTVIAASQTVVPLIPPQGSAQAVFTWNEPFASPYARIEIVPLLALPSLVP